MLVLSPSRGFRRAFTLVELMVVILIIAILVSLVSSAVVMAMGKIPEVQTRTEISQLDGGLQGMMADYGLSSPPPSLLILNESNPLTPSPLDNGQTAALLTKMFGRSLGTNVDWNGDGSINGPWTLQGEQALVFLLGGIPNTQAMLASPPPPALPVPPAPLGFSTNRINPATGGGNRKGPYVTFQSSRLYPQPPGSHNPPPAGWNGFFVYIDSWQSKAGPNYQTMGGSPYAFFSSAGISNNYAATSAYGAAPYFTSVGTFTNPNSWQIISAGKDGVYGTAGWNPSSGATGAGADDQANFSSKLLGTGQQ